MTNFFSVSLLCCDTEMYWQLFDCNSIISYNKLCIIYRKKDDYTHAWQFYEKILTTWKQIFNEKYYRITGYLSNMEVVYQNKKFSIALKFYQKVLIMHDNHFSNNYSKWCQSYNNIGNIHFNLNHFIQAIEYYKQALKIYQKYFSP